MRVIAVDPRAITTPDVATGGRSKEGERYEDCCKWQQKSASEAATRQLVSALNVRAGASHHGTLGPGGAGSVSPSRARVGAASSPRPGAGTASASASACAPAP